MFKNILLILIFIGCLSCVSVKETESGRQIITKLPERNSNFINLSAKLKISATLNGISNTATALVKLAYLDSLSVNIYGPFGITIGKMYADPGELMFYNTFTNQLLVGEPKANIMKAALFVPLSYSDFTRLIRCETPGEPKYFEFDKQINQNENLFKLSANAEYIEYVVYSSDLEAITQYQRKSNDGKLIVHIFYDDYIIKKEVKYAIKQIYKFPEIGATIKVDIDDLEINPKFEKKFSFTAPDNIPRINLNE